MPPRTRVVVLQPGGNDARRGIAGDRNANVTQIIGRLKARRIAIIWASLQPG